MYLEILNVENVIFHKFINIITLQKGQTQMNTIYNVIDTILPFSFLEYTFMKNAFLAILLITPLFGIIGTIIVNNKMAFFSDSIGHSALTGVAIRGNDTEYQVELYQW